MTAVHRLGPDTVDEVTGKTLAEMEAIAEDLYAHRAEVMAGGEEVRSEQVPAVRSVISVRVNDDELDIIAAAADAAGMPLSAYIRNAALASAAAVDVGKVRRELAAATRALAELGRALGEAG